MGLSHYKHKEQLQLEDFVFNKFLASYDNW